MAFRIVRPKFTPQIRIIKIQAKELWGPLRVGVNSCTNGARQTASLSSPLHNFAGSPNCLAVDSRSCSAVKRADYHTFVRKLVRTDVEKDTAPVGPRNYPPISEPQRFYSVLNSRLGRKYLNRVR